MVGVRVGCLMGFSAGSIVSVSVRRCVVIAIAVEVGSVSRSVIGDSVGLPMSIAVGAEFGCLEGASVAQNWESPSVLLWGLAWVPR